MIRRSQLHVVVEEETNSVLFHSLNLNLIQVRNLDILLFLSIFFPLDLLRLIILLPSIY